jgi:hypothetical protein
MNFFPSLPWNRGHPAPILNSFVVDASTDGSDSSSPSNPSDDLSSADTFAEINFADAFQAASPLPRVSLASTMVYKLHYNAFPISALAKMHQKQSCPVPSETVEGCVAGLLVLAQRANLTPNELTAEAMLTFLWILQSFHSQYGSDISTIVWRFTELLNPSAHEEAELQRKMLALQRQFLARLDWRIRLDNTEEIFYALQTLEATPGFAAACTHIKNEAKRLLEIKQEAQMLLARAAAAAAEAPSSVPVQFSASRILAPPRFPVVAPPVFSPPSYVTPIEATHRRFHHSSLSLLNLALDAVEEDDGYSLSDFEDIYSDLEDYEEAGSEEEEEIEALAAGATAAAAQKAKPPSLLGKRQRTPWKPEATEEEPPRRNLLSETNTNSNPTSSFEFFTAMSRPFLRAFQRR